MEGEDDIRRLLLTLLRGFHWCDESLQNYLAARGWTSVTTPQSRLMACVALGVLRPPDLARRLGVTRQAVHTTINQLRALGLIQLVEDPRNRGCKIIAVTRVGRKMRADAQKAMDIIGEELARRWGADSLRPTARFLSSNWGPPPTF